MYSIKKIVTIVVLLCMLSVGFSACGNKAPDGELVPTGEDLEATKGSLIDSAHPSEEFMEGVSITQVSDDTFGFNGPGGETVIDAELPDDFPEDVPQVLKGEILSSAKSKSVDGEKTVFTVFWSSGESLADLVKYTETIRSHGWEDNGADDFETSQYFRYAKDGRALDFSVAEAEEGKREVMVMVEK
ncbi:hypothetical protein KKH43_01095 [Patescibacteria group bacterium]|nr:hypothetical protein [Patescibacteria group bacterium]